MKKLFTLLLFAGCLSIFSAAAKPKTVLVNYYFDYSKAKIDKVSASTWFSRHYKDGGAAFKRRVARAMINAANNESMRNKGFLLGNSTDTRYEVAIKFLIVDKDGAHKLQAVVYNKKTKKKVGSVDVRCRGGRGDNFESIFVEKVKRSGEELGDKLVDDVLKDLYK